VENPSEANPNCLHLTFERGGRTRVEACPASSFRNSSVKNLRKWAIAFLLNEDIIQTDLFYTTPEGYMACEIRKSKNKE